MSEEKEPFLARWSRVKTEARRRESEAKPIAPLAPPAEAAPKPGVPAPSAEPPPLDSLQGLASDYKEFLQPKVDEALRRAALKKLFSDPHFNTMDGLDVYIDDYSKGDPIPEAMLKALEQAKGLVFDPEEKPAGGESQAVQAPGLPAAPQGADAPGTAGAPDRDAKA
ncbi:MAG: DUF3306 domain-containing protein [Betaproteobacteria bacterium]|nr:DUF3306 domain-containing protein [Betaproteobacteria bacterium]MBI2959420.1 DUF3306 domain-containing protein [Betaproteobacteria bacterium]